MENKKVYLAGKIGKNDWRSEIFKDLRDGNDSKFNRKMEEVDGFLYNGPFFVSCDHGCFHGESQHGRGITKIGCGCGMLGKDGSSVESKTSKSKVLSDCAKDIGSSTHLFVWIDSLDAYGTIAEIGIAYTLGIPIFISLSDKIKKSDINDLWFPLHMAKKIVIANSAVNGWKEFINAELK